MTGGRRKGRPRRRLRGLGCCFLVHDWLDAESLAGRKRYAEQSRATFDAAINLAADIAQDHYAPYNKHGDTEEPTLDGEKITMIGETADAMRVLARSGLISSTFDTSVGGMQLPHVVATACFARFQAANVATWSYTSLSIAAADLLCAHGSAEQVQAFALPMIEGRYHGTMCLSEPQVGSALADITTRAEQQGDGTYRLAGNKMWISGGDHELGEDIVHLVLARIPGSPPGVRGYHSSWSPST
jgi:alkylation response protein AidB-like acyl-CoA dehydrogenase